MTKTDYMICNQRKLDIMGADAALEICLKEKGHEGEHEFAYSPYIFRKIISRDSFSERPKRSV